MAQSAIIFKALEAEGQVDIYEQKFRDTGIEPILIPPVDFEFCNLDDLSKKLSAPSLYSGIIFTSPRAVKAVSLSLREKDSLPPGWDKCSMFVVGETTSRCLFDKLGLKSEGQESGSARELGERITKREFGKSLLFPCGNKKTDVLSQMLRDKNISVEEIMVYKTCQHPSLDDRFSQAIEKGIPDFFIFFSPSGVKYVFPLMKSRLVPMEMIKFVCIGPSTAAALQDNGIHVWATAEKPNPCSLVEAVTKLKQL